MSSTVTRGAISAIASMGSPPVQPVVQVLEIRSLAVPAGPGGSAAPERLKLKISDGEYFMQAMLATTQNDLFHDGKLVESCLIRLKDFVCNIVADRKICIIIDLEVVGMSPFGKIGNPASVDSMTAGGYAPPEMAPPPPAPAAYSAPAARPTSFGSFGGSSASAPGARGFGSSAVVATSSDTPRDLPIASLNPYNNKWTIKARVTAKGERRTWSNARGEGSLFSVDLLDRNGTQIRGTFFKEGVDKFYDVIHKDCVYYFSNGRLKAANKAFTSIANDYEISFDASATVVPAPEDKAIKHEQFSFVSIASIGTLEKDSNVDVIGIAKMISPASDFTSRAGKPLTKREITLVDTSATAVSLTLWGEKASAVTEASIGNVIAVKGARIGEYGGGRTISMSMSSTLVENPDVPEARTLRAWWDSEGAGTTVTSISSSGGGSGPQSNVASRKTIAAIKAENLGSQADGDVFTVKATINYIKSDGDKAPWYPACITPGCSKKAVPAMAGTDWSCEKCNISFDAPQYRYILSATIVDHTGSEWITLFNDQAVMVLENRTATDLAKLKDAGEAGSAEWNAVFQRANFKQYNMRLKAKKEAVSDQMRLKVTALALRPIEYPKECRALLDAIKAYDGK